MVAIDAGSDLVAAPRTSGLVQDLKALRQAVSSGRCRIGAQQSDSLPCLMGLIMEMIPYSEQRDQMIDAIAQFIPGDEMLRSQMRMMRYCRRVCATRRSVLQIIDRALVRSGGSIFDLGPRLAIRRLMLSLA